MIVTNEGPTERKKKDTHTYTRLVKAVFIAGFDSIISSMGLVSYWQHKSVGVFHLILRKNVVLVVFQRFAILKPDILNISTAYNQEDHPKELTIQLGDSVDHECVLSTLIVDPCWQWYHSIPVRSSELVVQPGLSADLEKLL